MVFSLVVLFASARNLLSRAALFDALSIRATPEERVVFTGRLLKDKASSGVKSFEG